MNKYYLLRNSTILFNYLIVFYSFLLFVYHYLILIEIYLNQYYKLYLHYLLLKSINKNKFEDIKIKKKENKHLFVD